MKENVPMKGLFTLLALLVFCIPNAVEATTNLLSISLLDSARQPIFPPVLTDKDFVSIDTTNQTFTITPEAARRLANTIWELRIKKYGGALWKFPNGNYAIVAMAAPFVLQASGETIRNGVVSTFADSTRYDVPVIIPNPEYVNTNLTTNVSFCCDPSYPALFSKIGQPGIDDRIASAVQKLFASKNEVSGGFASNYLKLPRNCGISHAPMRVQTGQFREAS